MEMDTYQGECKYCGNIQPVMAMDQIDANEKISEECSCGGAELERRQDTLMKNIRETVGEEAPSFGFSQVTPEQEELIRELAMSVLHGKISAVSLKIGSTRISISGIGEITIKRTDTKNKQMKA